MSLRSELMNGLRAVIRPSDNFVVLQSSLFHIATSGDALKWEALAAVRALAESGHTLALPAFTFSFVSERYYHHRHTLSGSGQLADWVYELPEASRTPHPIYSYVVVGPRHEELMACRGDTAFGQETVFDLFERENARIVMAGADWQELTQVHRYEELFEVPYRTRMPVEGLADFGAGQVVACVDMFVRDTVLDSVRDFTPVIEELRPSIDCVDVGRGALEAASCDAVRSACERTISSDPYVLVQKPRIIERRVELRGLEPLQLAVIGAQNVEVLANAVRNVGEGLLEGRGLVVHAPPFGQQAGELLDPESTLRTLDPDCTVFVDRLEDVYGTVDLDCVDELNYGPLDAHLSMLDDYARTVSKAIVVLGFGDLRPRPIVSGSAAPSPTRLAADRGNRRLAELAAEHGNIYLLDPVALAAGFADTVLDDRLWHVGRFPFSGPFSRCLAERIWGLVLAARGESARLLAVDLDGTLWGGVLGEDDVAGIIVGGDHPGNAFAHFQRVLRELRSSGMAIAICSRNDEDHALRVFRERSDMVLCEEDLVGWRIDWNAKPDNVAALAAELGIGLEHVLFIDDNPVEREAMRQRLPAVKILDLPADPARYVDALATCPYLTRVDVTEEDRHRTERYRARRLVERKRRTFVDVESFYASLDMALTFAPLSDANVVRAEQLSQKTNQFNTTTRRHRRADLRALADSGNAEVTVIGLADRFSEREYMGLTVVRHEWPEAGTAAIDSFLLSCRVLGRGVEHGVLAWIAEQARSRGMDRLLGTVVATTRNGPCRDIYREAGFEPGDEDGHWWLDLASAKLSTPHWLRLNVEAVHGVGK